MMSPEQVVHPFEWVCLCPGVMTNQVYPKTLSRSIFSVGIIRVRFRFGTPSAPEDKHKTLKSHDWKKIFFGLIPFHGTLIHFGEGGGVKGGDRRVKVHPTPDFRWNWSTEKGATPPDGDTVHSTLSGAFGMLIRRCFSLVAEFWQQRLSEVAHNFI